jgi:hypothetical protein
MKIISMLFVTLLLIFQPARANSFGTDMTDLWWNPNESGWGVTVTHQNEILFLTFFVYGADGKATWYGAPNVPFSGASQEGLVFTGPLYQTNGPWLGTTFNPSNVSARQVGAVTFTASNTSSANLVYTVDGTQVSKSIVRQTWRTNNLTGTYLGSSSFAAVGCTRPYLDGTYSQISGLSITNTSSTFALTTTDSGGTCRYTGNYVQSGRMGQSSGGYTCNDGTSGTYTAFELEANAIGITGRINAQNQFCSSIVAKFGALRD